TKFLFCYTGFFIFYSCLRYLLKDLINQLEQVQNGESNVRVGMATVLANIVSIAGTSIGPLLLAIFNSLLKLLRSSVEFQQSKQCVDLEKENLFQNTLIYALCDFASALPDYQKVEIMMFTAGSIPNDESTVNRKMEQLCEPFLKKEVLKMFRDKNQRQLSEQQNSFDTVSIGSSSVDWSPSDTEPHSRRNTVFSGQKNLNVEQLRILANTPLNVAEEERRDQA
uniref:Uncharacterized protein n=1 Tax=Meloidogyne incognita TaxID=6306 RepID=A0A914NQQ7_MELIC